MLTNRFRRFAFGVVLSCTVAPLAVLGTHPRSAYSGLIAHEWGTFTSIAGADGQPLEWRPLSGSTDLPSFVEHFRDAEFKLGLRGTVRMETPVLYFYSPRAETVSVKVSFAQGVITEWYPHASRVEPATSLYDASLYQHDVRGSIAWDAVDLAPTQAASLPDDRRANPYYAARQTTSTPLLVKTPAGAQYEKFLFYRGVSAIGVPISAKLDLNNTLLVENSGAQPIPNTILFERRGENIRFRINGSLLKQALLDRPVPTDTLASLTHEFEGILISQGLFQNEAQAMVQTWRDSWFEEGSRLLYIVPPDFVNAVLPLTIKPAPMQTARVFVGRLELITPETESAVERAFAERDRAALAKYARFLEPILNGMIEKTSDARKVKELRDDLNRYYNSPYREWGLLR
jgi:hypothetical protein